MVKFSNDIRVVLGVCTAENNYFIIFLKNSCSFYVDKKA